MHMNTNMSMNVIININVCVLYVHIKIYTYMYIHTCTFVNIYIYYICAYMCLFFCWKSFFSRLPVRQPSARLSVRHQECRRLELELEQRDGQKATPSHNRAEALHLRYVCVYIYTYDYVYICSNRYPYMSMHIYISIPIYTCIHTDTYVYMYIHMIHCIVHIYVLYTVRSFHLLFFSYLVSPRPSFQGSGSTQRPSVRAWNFARRPQRFGWQPWHVWHFRADGRGQQCFRAVTTWPCFRVLAWRAMDAFGPQARDPLWLARQRRALAGYAPEVLNVESESEVVEVEAGAPNSNGSNAS